MGSVIEFIRKGGRSLTTNEANQTNRGNTNKKERKASLLLLVLNA